MRNLSSFQSFLILIVTIFIAVCSCKTAPTLESQLMDVVKDAKGDVGVAVIIDGKDTVTVNNDDVRYPLMSVFKLHQAVALCAVLDGMSVEIDTLVQIRHDELNLQTWSPMLKDYPEGDFSLPMTDLLDYLLLLSDNNVSNILFDRFCSPERTDSIIRRMTGITDFSIRHTEHSMQLDHSLAADNWSSPLACAALINRVFTDSLVSPRKQEFLISALKRCETGRERIPAPFFDNDSITVGHRTGSGYINEDGVIAAVNDVAYITLPDGHSYSLAVLVKDFDGTMEGAERLIARISATVYGYVTTAN